MIRSASGTYSLPSARMKSYWVSTSQKMTRAMARNLSACAGACQPEGGQAKSLPGLEFEDYCNLVTARVARAPHAVGPHLERKVLAFGRREAHLQKERRLAGQREYLSQALRARLGDQRRAQRAAHARSLPILAHREPREARPPAHHPPPRDHERGDQETPRAPRRDHQQAPFPRRRDERGGRLRQLEPPHEPPSANLAYARRSGGEPGEARTQPCALPTYVGQERGIGDRAHHVERHARDEWPAAEGCGMV